MTKTLLALAFTVFATAASAQQRTFYDASGKLVGRSATDSQGSKTFYDATGKVTGRSSTNGTTTNIYDERGRSLGRSTTNRD